MANMLRGARTAALSGLISAWSGHIERQVWAVSTKHRPHAKGKSKVGNNQQIQSVPKLSLSAQRH
jgi:hypothetical protein